MDDHFRFATALYYQEVVMTKLSKNRRWFIVLSLIVPILLLIGFVVFPAFDLVRMSFTNWDGFSKDSNFIGINNYLSMFDNKDLWLSLKNNAVYFVVHLLMIPIELAFAVLLNSKLRAAKFYKTLVFMPYIINGVAIAYAFSYFFSPINGAFDSILEFIKLEGLSRNWLSDTKIINYVLSFVSVWRFSGYHVILFMAALQSIPKDIEEAANVDGTNAWQLFRYIQVPAIMLMVDFVLFDNIRGALQVFDIPFVMTSGGPGYASSTFTLYTIKTAFTYSNFGLASTMAVTIMVLIVVIYLIQNQIIHGLILRDRRK
jgi:multiple sugar transport system permease protein